MKTGFKQWAGELVSGSAICRAFDRLGNWLYRKLGKGLYSFLFGSYDDICDVFETSAFSNAVRGRRSRMRHYLAASMEDSVYVTAIASMMRYLSRLSLRVIGVFLLSSGFYSLLAQFILYLVYRGSENIIFGAVSAAMILMGIPFLFSGRALCTAVYQSPILGRLFTGFFGFPERMFAPVESATGRKNAAFILGLPFGILSCFVNPAFLLLGMLGLIFAYLVLLNPECGFYAILFALPFFVIAGRPTILLALLTGYVMFCFLVKLMLGKRYFRFELLDFFVACFMAVMFFGGIVTYGGTLSLRSALIYTVLMLGYFLSVGLLNSKDNLRRAVQALCVSLLLVGLYGLYQNFTGNISTEWIDTEMFDNIGGRVVSTFENPNMLGEYLILLLPILAAFAICERPLTSKSSTMVAFAVGAACLIYTWARGAWLGFLLAAVVFLLMWSRKSMALLVTGVCALPFLIPYLPESILTRFSSIGDLTDTSTNYRVYIWRGSMNLAADYAWTGIGVGESAFDRIYPYYSFAGIEKAPHAHNLFLQLFIEIGIPGFLIFAAFLFCFLQSGFSLAKCGEDRGVRLIGCGAVCGILAALVQGMTDYIWYNYRVFFVFWVVVGIASAARRIDAAERKRKGSVFSESAADITIEGGLL